MGRSVLQVSRREARIYVTLPVSLQTGWRGAHVASASTVDYYNCGLRVRANVPLRIGQPVVVVDKGGDHSAIYHVVWVRDSVGGQAGYEAGLAIQRGRQERLD